MTRSWSVSCERLPGRPDTWDWIPDDDVDNAFVIAPARRPEVGDQVEVHEGRTTTRARVASVRALEPFGFVQVALLHVVLEEVAR